MLRSIFLFIVTTAFVPTLLFAIACSEPEPQIVEVGMTRELNVEVPVTVEVERQKIVKHEITVTVEVEHAVFSTVEVPVLIAVEREVVVCGESPILFEIGESVFDQGGTAYLSFSKLIFCKRFRLGGMVTVMPRDAKCERIPFMS